MIVISVSCDIEMYEHRNHEYLISIIIKNLIIFIIFNSKLIKNV